MMKIQQPFAAHKDCLRHSHLKILPSLKTKTNCSNSPPETEISVPTFKFAALPMLLLLLRSAGWWVGCKFWSPSNTGEDLIN
jgi:hypothetical protein